MTKDVRMRGKISVSRYFKKYNDGEQVLLKAEPAVQSGMYPTKYHGKVGRICGKKGECYEVKIYDFKKAKTFIIHPIHLRAVKEVK